MNYFDYLDSTGYFLKRKIPMECIKECSAQGACDEAVEYWHRKLKFDADPIKAKDYLESMGAWDDSELLDHTKNMGRLLWIVCCDINEERGDK